MFGLGKQDAFKKFESLFNKVFQKQVTKRDSDSRNAFMTQDILRRRNELTKGGRQNLVLNYGTKGANVEYSLADLNKMANAAKASERRFGASSRGVPVQALLKACDRADISRAHTEITSSILYKIQGNELHFRVAASKESVDSYHQVRIRLDSWDSEMRGLSGGDYLQSAKRAATGRVSFNCDCGRHRYWYRYLATIGGFGLDPFEKVFPKIRNPGLKGCCCKHVVKTLAVLTMQHQVHVKLAKEMEEQGKKKGFFTKLFHGDNPQEKYTADADTEQASKASVTDMTKEFGIYQQAQKGFGKKMEKQKKADTKSATASAKKISQIEKDNFILSLQNALLTAKVNGKPRGDAISKFASDNNATAADIETIAKSYNL